MISLVSVLAGLIAAFCIGYRMGRNKERKKGTVLVIYSIPRDDPDIDIPREVTGPRARGQA